MSTAANYTATKQRQFNLQYFKVVKRLPLVVPMVPALKYDGRVSSSTAGMYGWTVQKTKNKVVKERLQQVPQQTAATRTENASSIYFLPGLDEE